MAIRPSKPSKRNSGRTGARRLTIEQAAARGVESLRDFQRRYGKPAVLPPITDAAPDWFTEDLQTIWHEVLASTSAGALAAADHPVLVAYCIGILTHRRLAQQIITVDDPAALEPRLRAAAVEVRAAARALGLRPVDRGKIEGAAPSRAVAAANGGENEFEQFDTILPSGERVPYAGAGKRLSTSKAN